ncbi:MAG: DNA polymerase IV [Dehalococcoidia bacterium]|nr:DNA polymerase IV [Dehalococcoidia bacterium]
MTIPSPIPRRIAHFDLDTFFVAVERLKDPTLVGQPVLVGGRGPRSVVATASYEARVFGCHSAQPMTQALRLCPQAIVVPPDFASYRTASEGFHAVLREASPLVESVGLDEAYADLTGIGVAADGPREAAEAARRRVRGELGLAVSVGIAGSRTVAKVASDRAKPDGVLDVPVGGDAVFLAPLPLRDLPFLGPRAEERLRAAGVRTLGQLAQLDERWLLATFGSHGLGLARRARGIDPEPVHSDARAAVSVSREVTFGEDVTDLDRLRQVLRAHAEEIGADLRASERRARTVTLKARWPDFTTFTRGATFGQPLQTTEQLSSAGASLLDQLFVQEGRHPVRLIGLGATNLVEDAVQLGFEDGRLLHDQQLDRAIDEIRDRFGNDALWRGLAPRRRWR